MRLSVVTLSQRVDVEPCVPSPGGVALSASQTKCQAPVWNTFITGTGAVSLPEPAGPGGGGGGGRRTGVGAGTAGPGAGCPFRGIPLPERPCQDGGTSWWS